MSSLSEQYPSNTAVIFFEMEVENTSSSFLILTLVIQWLSHTGLEWHIYVPRNWVSFLIDQINWRTWIDFYKSWNRTQLTTWWFEILSLTINRKPEIKDVLPGSRHGQISRDRCWVSSKLPTTAVVPPGHTSPFSSCGKRQPPLESWLAGNWLKPKQR